MGLKEKLPLLNSNKKGTRIVGYVVYGFLALMVLGAVLPDSPETTAIKEETSTDSAADEATTKSEETTPENTLTVGDIEDMLPGAFKNPKVDIGQDGEVEISYEDEIGWDVESWYTVALSDQCKAYKSLFEDPRIARVTLINKLGSIDKYGNEGWMNALSTTVSRTTAKKTNWDNLIEAYPENLLKIADSAYIHPNVRSDLGI